MVGKGPFLHPGPHTFGLISWNPLLLSSGFTRDTGPPSSTPTPRTCPFSPGLSVPSGTACRVDSKATPEDPQRAGAEQEARTG